MFLPRWCTWDAEYHPSPALRAVQYVLLALIIVGLILLATQRVWVPKLVEYILAHDGAEVVLTPHATEHRAPSAATPSLITLSGTYVCLPFLPGIAVTPDCAFGIHGDDGEYYAVNFGAGAGSMADFQKGVHITAKGTLILHENLKPDSWKKFVMKGLFTIMEKPTVGM